MAASRQPEPSMHAILLLLSRLFLLPLVHEFTMRFRDFITRFRKTKATGPPAAGDGLKVIACGFSRSGTMSLQLALQRIGFPCYHALNIRSQADHAELWLRASKGKLDEWESILRGYTAIVDFPAACLYEQLMATYPHAKVILNIRDPEEWYESCLRTVYRTHTHLLMRMFRTRLWRVADKLMFEGKFKGRFDDKDFAIEVYKKHIEEVRAKVPKEKLLVYEVKHGWDPLCNFLEVAIPPNTPFPRVNDTSSFHEHEDSLFKTLRLILVVYVALISFVIAVLLL